MKHKKMRLLLAILAIVSSHSLFAYELEELGRYKEAYPNNIAVILNHNQTVNIEVNESTGELMIFETDYEEILYLQPASKFYTSKSIYTSDFFEDITEIKVTVYDTRGKKHKLKDDDFRMVDSPPSSWVFHDDDKEMLFDLEDLGEGYRTVIEYTKRVKRPQFFDVFHFMSIYPIENSRVEIQRPANVSLKFYERNMSAFEVKRETVDLKKGIVKSVWEINKLKEYETESGATNIKNHIPHFIAQIVSYEAGGEKISLIGSPKELHGFFQEFLLLSEKSYKREDSESDKGSKNQVMEDLVDSMTVGMTTELAKMDTIFRWVQANIKYIAFEDGINGYVPRACNTVMNNRYGDCKDMGNLLVEMLNHAEVSGAKVAWVGTRDIPYLMSEIPTPLAFNHVICVVDKGDGSYYYLDATSTEGSYLLPPRSVQSKELLIHNDIDDFTVFKVPEVDAAKNYLRSVIRYRWDEDDSLRGSGTDHFGGYERERKTYTLSNLDNEDLFDYVKDVTLGGYNRYTLMDYDIQNLLMKNEELQISYDFSVDNLFIKLDNELILNPTLFKPRISQYNTEDHKLTRYKNHHRLIDYTYEFEIPEGYEVTHLPDGNKYEHELFSYASTYTVVDNVLQVNHTYQYHLLEIPTDLYSDWNAFSDAINAATIQNIILQKKN